MTELILFLITIRWSPNTEPDLAPQPYKLYAGPGMNELRFLGSTSDTTFQIDEITTDRYYGVSARDSSGNESDISIISLDSRKPDRIHVERRQGYYMIRITADNGYQLRFDDFKPESDARWETVEQYVFRGGLPPHVLEIKAWNTQSIGVDERGLLFMIKNLLSGVVIVSNPDDIPGSVCKASWDGGVWANYSSDLKRGTTFPDGTCWIWDQANSDTVEYQLVLP